MREIKLTLELHVVDVYYSRLDPTLESGDSIAVDEAVCTIRSKSASDLVAKRDRRRTRVQTGTCSASYVGLDLIRRWSELSLALCLHAIC